MINCKIVKTKFFTIQQLTVSAFCHLGFMIKQTYTGFIKEQLHSTTLSDHF